MQNAVQDIQLLLELVVPMMRWFRIYPGRDCVYAPCAVSKEKPCTQPIDPYRPGRRLPGNNHGIHGEEWSYGIAADDLRTFLALTVFTDIYPPTVPANHSQICGCASFIAQPLEDRRYGTSLALHVAAKLGAAENNTCDFLGGDPCDVVFDTGLGARAFFKTYGDSNQPEQGAAFWTALEAKFVELDAEWRA
jgi:hypothetical protein